MEQELIPLNLPIKWREAFNKVPHAFGHTWESCYAMHLTTGLPTYLYQFTEGDIKVLCPIAERNYMGYLDIVTPYGFAGFVGNTQLPGFQVHWRSYAQERGYVSGYIGLNSLLHNNAFYHAEEVFQYNKLYVLDLQLTIQELYLNLHLNRKRQLKNYESLKRNLIVDKTILKPFFLENYHSFFAQRNASQVYNFSIETISYLLDLENVFMVGVYQQNKVEAVSVFAYTPYSAEYLFNISLPEGQHHAVSLIWYGISHLKYLNVPYLNLGGGVKEEDSIAKFKQRFGANELPLTCLKQVYNSSIYEMLCHKVNKDPDCREGFFPPYWQL